MDFGIVAKSIVEDMASAFADRLREMSLEKQNEDLQLDEMKTFMCEQIELRIHGINWKSNILMKLGKFRDWKTDNGNWLAEWFVECLHKLICVPPKSKGSQSLKIKHFLFQYPPRDYILNALKSNKTLSYLEAQDKMLSEYMISRELNAFNIHNIFKLLIELEDVASLMEYVPFIQRNVTLDKKSKRRYCAKYNSGTPLNIKDVLTPNLDAVLVISKDESQLLNLKWDVSAIQSLLSKYEDLKNSIAFIKEVTGSSVIFEFDSLTKLNENKTKFDLIFFSLRYPIRYQHRALNLLADNVRMRNYLFPKLDNNNEYSIPTTNFDLLNSDIAKNPEQMQAVRCISSGPNPYAPYIIFGPPGTGKTTTIVESVLQLRLRFPESRILVTAGSNSACDTIALRICQYFKSSPRLQDHLSSANALPIIRIFSKSIHNRGVDNIPDELLVNSNVIWNGGRHAYPAVEDILKYGIVVATLCTVGKLVLADINVNNKFTHIFIDEAAASTEPETLVGIMGIKSSGNETCRVILSGDHKQLGPVLKSDSAIKLGLDLTLMERLLSYKCYSIDKNGNYDLTLQTRLRRNYRSHPEIVNIYNTLYYKNELLPMNSQRKAESRWSFLPNSRYPIVFQAVHGITDKEDTMSSCNILEIEVLEWYIRRLIKKDKVKPINIGVIAPYKLQCQHIRKRFNASNWKDIEVGSVENYQGREKEIIMVSMVRSFSNLGFLKNPRRLNVMLSRAKSLLIIIGNPISLRHYEDLNFVIEKCKENGTYLKKEKPSK